MEDLKLPYKAEYAKSGRAGCKGCKNTISKDSLRLAVMIQSPFFDGMQPNWYHFSCFFNKFRPKSVSDVAHLESLRWEDQEEIRKAIENPSGKLASSSAPEKTKNSKLRKRNNTDAVGISDIADYTIEYAKSKRAKCKVCEETINKDEMRISKKDYESEIAMKYGPSERWHHVDCFIKAREELGFFKSGKILPGFKTLSDEDQKVIKKKIPEIAGNDNVAGPSPPKKPKESEKNDSLKKKMKKQNDIMFKYHDELQLMKKSELQTLLTYNNQEIPEGTSRMVDRLSDAMAFGALKKCENCKGQLVFTSGKGYVCTGYSSEWSKCGAIYKNPSRQPFKIPEDLKESYSFLDDFKSKVTERMFNETSKIENDVNSNSEEKNLPILTSFKIYIHKTEGNNSDVIKKQILSLGGSVAKKYDDDILAIISTNSELKKPKLSKILKSAQDSEIPVLPENFFEDIKPFSLPKDLIAKISEKKISSWNSDVSKKIHEGKPKIVKKSVYPEKASNSSDRFKSNETVKKFTLKDGLAVDPDSNLEKVAHVYRKGKDIYSTVLSLTDVQSGKNSYYRMQILESDKKHKYWLFKAWGRIGTTIGGNKCDRYESLEDCIELFKQTFEEQTGNVWEKRKNFKKIPGKKIMLELEYNEGKGMDVRPKPKLESKILSVSVQRLISLIFDVEEMKKTMLEFELDLNKMPLGKISKKQIQKAFQILTDLQNLNESKAKESDIIGKTNMFYSLVPHDFGINGPPLLNDVEIIKQKIDMLNSLLDIEIAFQMWQECENSENPIDEHYKQLNAEITDLDPNSEEYKTIELYVKNTHAKTHMNYTLEIEQVFKIRRKGESSRYKKFNKLPNRKLLWHGSRVTNFAGILSQGLRIAPPEAPVTGYMFGKGIYFADMVSKSANYCSTSKKNPTGLLLLCEVALGEMLELTEAKYVETLPPGKHSVKGLGKTHPDPSKIIVSPSGVEVPVGTGIDSEVKESALLYNEYIVYDVDQVKLKYLLRLKFNYKI